MKSYKKQAGFTLVELIVVIIILGILSAVALPKFIDVTDQAHESAVKGTLGGLGAGVALFHAQWVANGHSAATGNVAGFGSDDVDSNDEGWPVKTAGGGGLAAPADAADCLEIWNGVMQSPPTAATTANTEDYFVSLQGGNVCRYEYEINSNNPLYRIQYDTDTGVVTFIEI